MGPLMVFLASAHAGNCGHLFEAPTLPSAVRLVQSQHHYVNYEGGLELVPLLFRMADGEPSTEATSALFQACGDVCRGLEVIRVDGRTDIRATGFHPRLLDTLVVVPAGERTFVAFAEELRRLLEEAARTSHRPLVGVDSDVHPNRRLVVPEHATPVAARDLLASLQVLPWNERSPTIERVGWVVSGGVQEEDPQGILLTAIDLVPLPVQPVYEPPVPGRVTMREQSRAMIENHPPPGITDVEIEATLAPLAAMLPAAERFDARAANACDPPSQAP